MKHYNVSKSIISIEVLNTSSYISRKCFVCTWPSTSCKFSNITVIVAMDNEPASFTRVNQKLAPANN